MTLRVMVESDHFPTGKVANGKQDIQTTWNDILWAAVTVGRPSRQYVFRHGNASSYEALFRWSLVRMSLEQNGPNGSRLHRTMAAKTLDPSEKAATNYFLGMTFCKLFAAQLLNTPWLLHLDHFRPLMNVVLSGRSRPDFIGMDASGGQWHAFESKGRSSPPDVTTKTNAKAQAQRLVSVNGTACSLQVGSITFFRNDVLEFYWLDPPPEGEGQIDVKLASDAWSFYYSPIADLVSARDGWGLLLKSARVKSESLTEPLLGLEEPDLSIGIYLEVAEALMEKQWNQAQRIAVSRSSELKKLGYQPDGIRVVAGKSWLEPYNDQFAIDASSSG